MLSNNSSVLTNGHTINITKSCPYSIDVELKKNVHNSKKGFIYEYQTVMNETYDYFLLLTT